MPHTSTKPEIIQALESNEQTLAEYFSSIPERQFFDGGPERWSPAHHLVHLTKGSTSVSRALRSGALPLHSTGRSRTYAEVRDAAAGSLTTTPADQLREMGRTVVVAAGTSPTDVVDAFTSASTELRTAAATWAEDALDRHALAHPLIGQLTVREMLFFCVFHERHHLKNVRSRIEESAR